MTASDTEEEELENLRIITLLHRELSIPFLFLAGGGHCQLVRTIGPMPGCAMWLTMPEYHLYCTKSQILCSAIQAIRSNFSYTCR